MSQQQAEPATTLGEQLPSEGKRARRDQEIRRQRESETDYTYI